ncbi:MAG TPA: CDP-diacylglycerol--glycerol-3-phosphate 3-phosphatidyltransferase [Nocardioidaceae bacterium]|nr:CDP-diacylglycerol--glycerol-3-phosphate 3-phosphatidyltransferase [Nocardioidaceae bacterium]
MAHDRENSSPTETDPSPWNLPNALTMLRIALVPVFGWLLLVDGGHEVGWRVAAFVVFLGAILTDKIDGDLARARGLVTNFGKIADPIADKALTGMAFVGLSVLGDLPWWVTVVVLGREWSITLIRFVVLRYGVMAASRGGKLKTTLQAVALCAFILPLAGYTWLHAAAWAFMVAAVVVTVVTGIEYVGQAVRVWRTGRSSHGSAA